MQALKSTKRSWDDYKKTMSQEIDAPDYRGFTPLMLAAYRGELARIRDLLVRGANPNFPDFGGNTPLMGVAFKGNVAAAEILLKQGASLRIKNRAGMDAYDFAVLFERSPVVELFIRYGAEKRKSSRLKSFLALFLMGIRQVVRTLQSSLASFITKRTRN